MKKLLSLFAVVSIVSTSATGVVACGTKIVQQKPSEKNKIDINTLFTEEEINWGLISEINNIETKIKNLLMEKGLEKIVEVDYSNSGFVKIQVIKDNEDYFGIVIIKYEIQLGSMAFDLEINNNDTKNKFELAYETWKNYENRWIAAQMGKNLVVNLTKEEFENFKKGVKLKTYTIKRLTDVLGSNLRVYNLMDSNQNLNPEELEFSITEVGSPAWKENEKSFSGKVTYKGSDDAITIGGHIAYYDYEKIDKVNMDAWRNITEMVSKSHVNVYQQMFNIINFNGKKLDTPGIEGRDWAEDQWVSVKEMKWKNADFLSSRLRLAGIISDNITLNPEVMNIEMINEMYIKPHPTIEGDKMIFVKESDFGKHSIVTKAMFSYPGLDGFVQEVWGSYLQSHIKY